jgi:hypothetical protein
MKATGSVSLGIAFWLLTPTLTLLAAQQTGTCEAAKAEFAVGQRYSAELAERAGRAAGARDARKLSPGGVATTDLREDRLNLHVDDQDTVRRVTCG